MLSKTATTGAALAAAAGMILLPAATGQADAIVPLPSMSYVHQVLVDDSAGYVFISEGYYSWHLETSGGGIVVTNLAGSYVTTLDAGDAAEGMAISGGTLYAALDADGAVAAIDISTIAQSAPAQTLYPLGGSYLPYDLTLQSGELWVSYGLASSGFGAIGEIDLAAAEPVFSPAVLTGPDWYDAPDLASDPANDGYLAAAVPGEEPVTMATYDVAEGATAPLAQTGPATFNDCGSEELGLGMAVGGATFGLICDGYSNALAFSTDTLEPDGTYGSLPSSDGLAGAVTVAADGSEAVSAAGGPAPGTSAIGTYTASGAALNVYQSSFANTVMTNGLAWSQNDTTLYAVLVSDSGDPPTASYSLEVIDNAVAPTLSITGPSTAVHGTPVSLSGTLTLGTMPAPGALVTISRTRGTAVRNFSAVTNAGGTFTFVDRTHPSPGQYTYTASYKGATASQTVTITPAPKVGLTLHGFYATSRHHATVYRLYRHSAQIVAAVKVAPASAGECVRLQLQEHHGGRWHAGRRTSCAELNGAGKVRFSIAASKEKLGSPYRIRAFVFASSAATVSGGESGWQYFKVGK